MRLRRFLSVVALLGASVLTGFGHRGAPAATSPPATPAPTSTPAMPASAVPVIMIYPFTVNGDADKTAGKKLADLFLSQMATIGGVTVKPIPTTPIERTDYLTDAIKNGADYYISGFLTPLGNEVAIVEQVVSTTSGAIVWANTAQVLTYGDAASQADTMRKVVIAHAGRFEAEYRQEQTQAPPTPGADQRGASTNIGGILGLLKHATGGKRGPAPIASVAPDKKPLRAILVVGRDDAGTTLERALNRFYRVSNLGATSGSIATDAHKACATFSNVTLASGELRKEQTNSFPRNTLNVFTLHMYHCDGSNFFNTTARAGSLVEAVDQTVAAYVAAHPENK